MIAGKPIFAEKFTVKSFSELGSFVYSRPFSFSGTSAISNMRFSDLILLKEGVFQLEEGHGQWYPDQCEAVVIQFAGPETELSAKRFEDDDEVL